MSGPARVALSDGNSIPQLGFGTGQVATADCPVVVGEALATGYRSIDTAEAYGNEDGVGFAVRESGIPRTELFITSKLRNSAHARDAALRSFDETMHKLGLERLDLFLIHWPVPSEGKYVEAWQTLIELQREGRVSSIGVSNFERDHIERLIAETGVVPVVNQIELHPRFQQRALRGYHKRRGIQIVSWTPLGPGTGAAAWWHQFGLEPKAGLFDDPTIRGIAEKHGKTPAQVIIRWHLDDGLVLTPKSTHPERIRENFAVFDFALDAEDRYRIEALDDDAGRIGGEPASWDRMF